MKISLKMSSQIARLKELIEVARGVKKADVVLKKAEIVNVVTEEIYTADIAFCKDLIAGIGRYEGIKEIDAKGLYAVPGLIDGHMHIEMSMLSVSEFAKLVVPRGTTAVVADPHEIANVLGKDGIKLILEEAKHTPLRVFCLVPSCVPSSPLETSGAKIDVKDVEELLSLDGVIGLAEVMNFPGVITCDDEVLLKILASKGKIVDGHCPKLSGKDLNAYVASGIMSDHESTELEEAKEKLRLGMRIMIREGSAARNLTALKELAGNRYTMLVTDGDRDVIDLINEGYLDYVFRRAIEEGVDEIKALQMLTINPAEYFGINAGVIAPGKLADVILLNNLRKFDVARVFIGGADPIFKRFEYPEFAKNTVKARKINLDDIRTGSGKARIIEVFDGEIITGQSIEEVNGISTKKDILKAVVVERHTNSGRVGKAFVRGFGIKKGAIAQSIAHDAHNIVAVGASDEEICAAVNRVIDLQGGIVVVDSNDFTELQLRIAGIMSDEKAEIIAEKLEKIRTKIRDLGCRLKSPLITLSFIALPVIPKLKVTDLGLVDVEEFQVVDLFVHQP